MPMRTHAAITICPFCNKEHDKASGLTTSRAPKPGNITLCIVCGNWSVFDDKLALRRPTFEETLTIGTSEKVLKARKAWELTMRHHKGMVRKT